MKNVKFVLNDVKVTAFSGTKRRDIRAPILVPLASQSNVTRYAHNDVLLHPDTMKMLQTTETSSVCQLLFSSQ